MAQNVIQSIFVKINTIVAVSVKKSSQRFGLLLKSSKLPKVSNHPLGKNLPNLVTLDLGSVLLSFTFYNFYKFLQIFTNLFYNFYKFLQMFSISLQIFTIFFTKFYNFLAIKTQNAVCRTYVCRHKK
jgi:hypothetical protein